LNQKCQKANQRCKWLRLQPRFQ